MDKSELIKPFEGVAARTNMLKINDNLEQLVTKLMSENSKIGKIAYSSKEIRKETKEDLRAYYLRIDSEIKEIIRGRLELEKTEPVKYDRLIQNNKVMFFFIDDKADASSEKLLEDVKRHNFELGKVVQTLLSLRLKLAYFNDISQKIKPTLYNSKLYVGAIKTKEFKNGDSKVEALEVDLFFSKQNEIALLLHKKVFRCIYEQTFIPATHDSRLLFHHKSKTLQVEETLDAVRYADRPYMVYSQKEEVPYFSQYENCINYHLTISLNKFITMLSNADIAFNPIEFKANYIVSEFIESNEQYCNPLMIIDAYSSYKTEGERIEFRKYLKQTFNAQDVLGIENAPKPEQLETKNISYLVINEEQKKNGSSIIRKDTGESFNSFFQALAEYSKDTNIPFDDYTSIKIQRFLKESPSVTQGINLENTKEINPNLVKKIKTELWLKERIFHYGSIEGIDLPSAELTLFFVRKLENKQTYVSVVDVMTNHEGIKINNQQRYETKDESRFKFEYKYLEKAFPLKSFNFAEMHNGSFYLYDKIHQKLLVSYSSSAIPRLIGNASFDNVERNKLPNGINREVSSETCVLPYYINPTRKKQRYYVFLEDDKQQGVRYFISNAGVAKAKIDKQRLTQNLFVFNQDGTKTSPLKEEITILFLQSFTFDILNNEEVSKKSIFQKVAELYIEN